MKKYLKKTNNSKSAASRSQVPAKPISTESKEPRGGATVSSSGHTPICQSKLGGKQNKKSWDLLKDKICPKDKSA